MNWYHRVERRYIEYGSSFEATRTFGLFRSMYDLVYNMNLDHLSWEAQTVFERLGDAGVRTASTPFLIYRGGADRSSGWRGLPPRSCHGQLPPRRLCPRRVLLRRPLRQPRPTGCTSEHGAARDESLGLRRRGAGESGLRLPPLRLPDNDFHSHRHGPEAQTESIAKAASTSRASSRPQGVDAFLRDHAVILTADHAQTAVEQGFPRRGPGRGLARARARRRAPRGGRDRRQPDLARAPCTSSATGRVTPRRTSA